MTLLRRSLTPSTRRQPWRDGPSAQGSMYPLWFVIPAAVLFLVLFAVPTFASFYFSLTRWSLFDVEFIGFDNFVQFFREPQLVTGFVNTIIYGLTTSIAKVVLGLALAVLLTAPILGRGYLRSVVFFPVLVSTIGIGIAFKVLLDPFDGAVNTVLAWVGIDGPGWLTDPSTALLTVAAVDVWKGVGIATLIFIAGIVAIPQDYFEAARMDGATGRQQFVSITLPLSRPAIGTVIVLSLIGGLRSFDLIWAMTKGGPGFTSDVIASVIYKQYQAGFYGLSTAGNVILFVVVAAIMVPLSFFLNRRAADQ
ncbi:sugar ABC transporter permease [Rathayibacter sp. VKM Ac-2760]|uniref:carbohydrate ABC transporter permease n=1 Tax=Rathayibacter sp. VKM Ac-2760 TaxID=2609253 RepID=UPI001317FD80|nr:sugar ABC transporter permease [Rathayibacter sp. VKM Ac-2760]QHC61171.1 ABC transporter permease subunit [Rathayibacter sp. VKM Ac-2760]